MSKAKKPPVVSTPQGHSGAWEFNYDHDSWKILSTRGTDYISFKTIRKHWGDGPTDSIKQAALAYLTNRSAKTVSGAISRLASMARTTSLDENISAATLMDYRYQLSREELYYLGHIAAFLKFWIAHGYPGVDPDVLQFFDRITIPGNVKGQAVRTHHPTKGPFTQIELKAIVLAAREAHSAGDMSTQDFAILLMLTATGSRPGQLSMLVCGDLLPIQERSNSRRLLIPSLKKRTHKRLTRRRVIPAEIASLLQELVNERAHDARFTGIGIPADQRPIFTHNAEAFPSPESAHIGAGRVTTALKRIERIIGLRSARTGAPIVLSARRFRTALGTRAAEAGHPPVIIADLLDHGDLQHVGVYVESRPSIVGRMDAALQDRVEPLVGLFRGTIVQQETASGVEEATSRRVAADAGVNVGTCGGPTSCIRLAPLACYTCASFRPWQDAPHETLLKSLVDERAMLLADGISPQIASAKDGTILAIAEVANRCRRMRETESDG